MRFKINEKVSFLHETGTGTIISYKSNLIVIIQDEHGFTKEVHEKYLVATNNFLHKNEINTLPPKALPQNNQKSSQPKKNYEIPGLTTKKDLWELDIHAHQIMESEKGKSNGEILNHQIQVLKLCFSKAKEKGVSKLIVIHGVGKGVLKNEVTEFLKSKMGIEYEKADPHIYGNGATEIRIFRNQ